MNEPYHANSFTFKPLRDYFRCISTCRMTGRTSKPGSCGHGFWYDFCKSIKIILLSLSRLALRTTGVSPWVKACAFCWMGRCGKIAVWRYDSVRMGHSIMSFT